MKWGKEKNNLKVLVALSGGVDSSVAAALLKERGYFVVGVFMKFWQETRENADLRGNGNRCCSGDAYEAAKSVCAKLDIHFRALDVQKEFKKEVVDYFLREYKAGRTPNPCVRCNEKIKFKILLKKAKKWGIEFVATGHYARLKRCDPKNPNTSELFENKKRKFGSFWCNSDYSGRLCLFQAKDKEKDQSYFLYNLTQEQLRHILFPLGDYTKEEARKLAKKWELATAERPESFEVCFVSDKHTADFLARHIKTKPGKIVDEKGREIGEHRGLPFYTIGQRRGINIGGARPYYVAAKNPARNKLVVVNNPRSPLLSRKNLVAEKVNWISGILPKFPFECRVKIRYRHKAALALVYKIQNTKYKIQFNRPQRAITPGQSVVFYKGQEVLGGGVIC